MDGKHANNAVGQKRLREESKLDSDVGMVQTKLGVSKWMDPAQRLANVRHEFGEHGGVNMSIEASSTFTVMEPETMGKLFAGQLGPERDYYIYSRCQTISQYQTGIWMIFEVFLSKGWMRVSCLWVNCSEQWLLDFKPKVPQG